MWMVHVNVFGKGLFVCKVVNLACLNTAIIFAQSKSFGFSLI